MNKVILIGRLTRDPQVSYSSNGNAVARFTIAVDRRYKREGDDQSADFISCVAFRQRAEFLEKYCKKGIKLAIEGSIQTGSYTNKDGQKVYTTDVLVDNLEFAESKNSQGGGSDFGGGFDQPSGEPAGGFMNLPDGVDEELPFN